MASYCPKCGYKLSMIDVKPECPICGVNLVYYGMEDSLKKEADEAEYEHALSQPRFDRLKAATIGSSVSIIRLVIGFLPLIATLLPMGKVTVSLPYFTETVTINIVTIIQKVFMDLDFDFLFAMVGSSKAGSAYICYFIALISLIMIVLLTLINLINLIIACGKRGIRRNITVASIGLFFTVLGQVTLTLWISMLSSAVPEIFSGSAMIWGALGIGVSFIAEIVINIVYKKKDIKVKYKDVSQYLIAYDERDHSEEGEAEVVKVEE